MAKHYALEDLGVVRFDRLGTLSNTPPPFSPFDAIESHLNSQPQLEAAEPQVAAQGWSNIMYFEPGM